MAVTKRKQRRSSSARAKRKPPEIVGPHGDKAQAAITRELVRVTLAGRPERPELEVQA